MRTSQRTLLLSLSRVTFTLIMGLVLAGQALGGKSPSISGLSPTSGAVGTSVTVSGANFGTSQGSSTLTFNGVAATPSSWKTGSIVATVPAAATTGPVIVKVSGTASNSVTFTVTPVISNLSPTSGAAGTTVAISGSGFGASQGSSTVSFNGKSAAATSWNVTTIGTSVPSGAATGPVVVTVNGVASNGLTFTVPPTLVSIAVSPQNSSLALGLGERFTATGTYSDSSTADISSIATWTSLNTTVATMGSGGWATSRSAGNTTITATYANVSGSAPLTVTAPTLLSTAITPQSIFLPPGATQQFTATATYSDGTTQNVTASVTWASSNTAVTTVNTSGVATGVGSGTATVTAATTGFTSATAVTVTSPGPPTITASASPSPNAAGWNNTNVTVTFTCTPGGAVIVTCPSAQTVSTEGASQVVSGTVTDSVGNNATASVTLNIDKTPPVLGVSSPVDGSVFTTSSITATGTLSDALSGLSTLTCNGAPVTPGASFSCSISLNSGLNLVAVRATDIAGNVSLTKMHVVLNAPLPAPLSLQIAPANANLVVGDSQPFTAVDDQGRLRTDATWTISNHTVATITTDASPWLTALAAGSATLTATAQGVSTQTQITVLSGTLLPGTPSWTVTPLPGLSVTGLWLATPFIGGTPDIYSMEGAGSTVVLRGLTIDGQHLWKQSLTALGNVAPLVSDAFGGMLGIGNSGLIDLDGQTGTPVWQAPVPSGHYLSNFAVRPDGDILALETDSQTTQIYLDVFDGNTGGLTMSIPFPLGQETSHEEYHCGSDITVNDTNATGQASSPNQIVIDEQGNAYVGYQVINRRSSLVHSTCNYLPDAGVTTETDTVGLLKLSTDGSTSLQTVTSSNFVQQDAEDSAGNLTEQDSGSASDLDRAIPDGQGGMLIAWDQTAIAPQETAVRMITDTSSGASFPIPMDSDPQQLIVGENGTAFVSNTTGSVSFDMNSGTVNWTYHPPSGYQVSMIASISGNGLAAQLNATSGISATLVRLDPTGTATVDPWTAAGIENYGGSQWLAISNGALSAISAAPVELSAASWYAADGNGGNAAIQNISVTNFSQSGANQTTISNVLQKIQTALPNYATCNNWLQGSGKNQGTSGLSEIQQLLQFNAFGHGTVHLGSAIDYDTWAFSGVINPDKSHISGVPDGIAMTVHDLAGFFNTNYPNSAPYNGAAYLLGPRQYPGDSLRAQGATVIHEVAHQITVAGFQPDFGNDKAEKANNKAVDANCRQLIEGVR